MQMLRKMAAHLEGLGATVSAVAQTLRMRNVKAVRKDEKGCALAVELKTSFEDEDLQVEVWGGGEGARLIRPSALQREVDKGNCALLRSTSRSGNRGPSNIISLSDLEEGVDYIELDGRLAQFASEFDSGGFPDLVLKPACEDESGRGGKADASG